MALPVPAPLPLQALSEALDGLLHGFSGEPDYYFGPRQFDELVLPALRGTLPGGGGGARPLGQMVSVAGEMLLHVDCEVRPGKKEAVA